MENRLADDRRNFLIVSSDSERRQKISEAVQLHIAKTSFTFATDGSDAILKIQNSQPDVIVADEDLAKVSGTKLVEWAIKNAKKRMACVLLGEIPNEEKFVDEVIVAKVQFVDDFVSDASFAKALSRALNYLSSGGVQEFSLRFLAPSEVLLTQGASAKSVYILRRGKLVVTLTLPTGDALQLGTIAEGEFVGEMAYINGEPRSANVAAIEDCELIQIPIDMMDHILFKKPAWAKALLRTLSLRLKRNNDAVAKI